MSNVFFPVQILTSTVRHCLWKKNITRSMSPNSHRKSKIMENINRSSTMGDTRENIPSACM